jgi:hypothetical protein
LAASGSLEALQTRGEVAQAAANISGEFVDTGALGEDGLPGLIIFENCLAGTWHKESSRAQRRGDQTG